MISLNKSKAKTQSDMMVIRVEDIIEILEDVEGLKRQMSQRHYRDMLAIEMIEEKIRLMKNQN